ncbi:MAG: hybrid sensor histidine kinase/response regulator [bacterium]|nr:hybrid sensor histidine kinase/response regulator [bacterium]
MKELTKLQGLILVVDDSERNRKLCKVTLETDGHTVLLAENGVKCLEMAKEYMPDLILLDIMMPEIDGFETLEILKSSKSLAHIPVLMLTAKAETEDVVKALKLGAHDYLKKPFDIDELWARVSTLIRLKKAEEKLKKSISILEHEAAIGTVATGVAHDFNNILTSLMITRLIEKHIGVIRELPVCGENKKLGDSLERIDFACGKINESVKLGQMLCESITTFANGISAGQQTISIAPLLDSPIGIFRRKLESCGIELVYLVEENVPPIRCRSGEIQRVLLNLITNAIDAMEDKEGKILTVRLRHEKEFVKLEVTDTGTGIAENVLEHIFENRYTTKKKRKGAGIGLSTVKKIVDAHNGSIDVKTNTGQGTTFSLAFPIAEGFSDTSG